MQIGIPTTRILLEPIHIWSHSCRVEDRVLLVRDGVRKVSGWEAMVRVVKVHLKIVGRVFDDLESKTDPLCLACDHVVWAFQVVEQLLFRLVGDHLVFRRKDQGRNVQNLFGQHFIVLVNSFLHLVLMVNHANYGACSLWRRPTSLAYALVGHEIEWSHPVAQHVVFVWVFWFALSI